MREKKNHLYVDNGERSIKNDCAYIFVNKELQRVNRNALEQLGEKGVMFKFPPAVASTHTALVLKESKTSIRKIFLPKTVAEMLLKLLANPEMAALLKSLAKNL